MADKAAKTRIVVTGVGAVSALGHTVGENWAAARDGRGGIKKHALDPGKYAPPPAPLPLGIVEPGVQESLEKKLARRVGALDPTSIYALTAVHEALSGAGLVGHAALEKRATIVFGHGNGGAHTLEKAYERYFGMKTTRAHPLTVPRIMVSAPVSAISMEFGIKGPAFGVTSACSSSAHSIAQGAMMIQSGV